MSYKKPSTNAHEFALYIENLSTLNTARCTITQKDIASRITSVLRLRPGDHIILFDAHIHIKGIIESLSKHSVEVIHISQSINKELLPEVCLYLPLLKRDDLADAVSQATATGVSIIQLVQTQKTQGIWSQKEKERLERCIIAAAEQSKHFKMPALYDPLPLKKLIAQNQNSLYIFLDPQGIPLAKLIDKLYTNSSQTITILVGPEGDLTQEEKLFLQNQGVIFCALTPTILRASLAAILGVGIVRSIAQK